MNEALMATSPPTHSIPHLTVSVVMCPSVLCTAGDVEKSHNLLPDARHEDIVFYSTKNFVRYFVTYRNYRIRLTFPDTVLITTGRKYCVLYYVSPCHVQGVANQSKRCAMCRQEIPADFLDHPTLVSAIEAEKEEAHPGGYQWFYEGRNGESLFPFIFSKHGTPKINAFVYSAQRTIVVRISLGRTHWIASSDTHSSSQLSVNTVGRLHCIRSCVTGLSSCICLSLSVQAYETPGSCTIWTDKTHMGIQDVLFER